MTLKIKFEDPLTINVNVNVTQKQDERVAELEKRLADQQIKIDEVFKGVSDNTAAVKRAVDENQPQ